jgi:hypothetical protein
MPIENQAHLGARQTPVKIATPDYRPPIIQIDLQWPPIGHPTQDDQALLDQAAGGPAPITERKSWLVKRQLASTARPMMSAVLPWRNSSFN